jgi:hypothetical protein
LEQSEAQLRSQANSDRGADHAASEDRIARSARRHRGFSAQALGLSPPLAAVSEDGAATGITAT